MNNAESSKIVAVLMLAFPAEAFPSELWDRMLADLEYRLVNAAVDRHIATSRFPPTIAAIREAALAVAGGEVRPGADAWGDVRGAIGRFGRYRTPGVDFQFGDPVVDACITPVIWRELCDSENQTADRARFIEQYDKQAAAHRRLLLSGTLPAVRQLAQVPRRELGAGPISDEQRKARA